MTNPNPTIVFSLPFECVFFQPGEAERFLPHFTGIRWSHTHTNIKMHINKHMLTQTHSLMLCCFWQWSGFAWGLVCFWLCGRVDNPGTNCCSLARNLIPCISRGSVILLTTDWDKPVGLDTVFNSRCFLSHLVLPNGIYSLKETDSLATVNLASHLPH